ncbi:hypothetical protein LCGC14_1005810 [marine sediment metagenome]|uniref:HNH nuclease domain-containing protein n=1 Tax=marine sediment metagenome TaxID=412755 RepID=A0A0F9NN49_9ZZZZ
MICIVDNCERNKRSNGYCTLHYYRFRVNGDPNIVKTNRTPPKTCTVDGCKNKYVASGLCRRHYWVKYTYGNPTHKVRIRLKNQPKICINEGCNLKTVSKGYCDNHYRIETGINIKRSRQRKIKVIDHYSNNKFECDWCNVKDMRVLSIDHINGGGNKHRKESHISDLYWWLIKNNYPKGFRVLCMNCNWVARTDKKNNGEWVKNQLIHI